MIQPGESANRVVLLCRNPARRALLERLVRAAETHASPVEAILTILRGPARAVVVNLEDVEGSHEEVVAAMRRARPDLPVYTIVRPEDEPLGRRLLHEGAADYFVVPGDVNRLPQVLEPKPPAAPRGPGAEPASQVAAARDQARSDELFAAACGLAELATAESHALFRDGAALVLRAAGARRGYAFAWQADAHRLDLVATVGEAAGPPGRPWPTGAGPADDDAPRALAERALRTGEVLFLDGAVPGSPSGGLLCLPVREADATFGVLCLAGKADQASLTAQDREAVGSLARMLARLHRGALQREQYARLALRDAETGLLKADTFRTCVEKMIARAAAENAQVALVLLEPRDVRGAAGGDVLGRLGRAVQESLVKGARAGRVGAVRFGIVLSRRRVDAAGGERLLETYRAWADEMAALGPRVEPGLALRTGLAVYPADATTADALVAAAEGRLV